MTGTPSPESERRLLRWLQLGLKKPISHQVVQAMSELGRAAEVIAAAIRATGEAGRGKSLAELLQRQEQIDTLAQLVGHVVAARDAVDAAAQRVLAFEKQQFGGSEETLALLRKAIAEHPEALEDKAARLALRLCDKDADTAIRRWELDQMLRRQQTEEGP